MTFIKKLKFLFLFITVVAAVLLIFSWYKDYQFDHNPLTESLRQKIIKKESELLTLIKINYGININIPLIITNKMNKNLFGMATFDTNTQKIRILLNKKRFKESQSYMLKDVLPHEYAHALMFYLGDFSKENSGHTLKWQEACKRLNGIRCNRFVDYDDIIIDKTRLIF